MPSALPSRRCACGFSNSLAGFGMRPRLVSTPAAPTKARILKGNGLRTRRTPTLEKFLAVAAACDLGGRAREARRRCGLLHSSCIDISAASLQLRMLQRLGIGEHRRETGIAAF